MVIGHFTLKNEADVSSKDSGLIMNYKCFEPLYRFLIYQIICSWEISHIFLTFPRLRLIYRKEKRFPVKSPGNECFMNDVILITQNLLFNCELKFGPHFHITKIS